MSTSIRKPAPTPPVPPGYFQPFILTGADAFRYVNAPAAKRRAIREQVEREVIAEREAKAAQPKPTAVVAVEDDEAPTPPKAKAARTKRGTANLMTFRARLEYIEALDLFTMCDALGIAYNNDVTVAATFKGSRDAVCELADQLALRDMETDDGTTSRSIARRMAEKIDRVTGVKL